MSGALNKMQREQLERLRPKDASEGKIWDRELERLRAGGTVRNDTDSWQRMMEAKAAHEAQPRNKTLKMRYLAIFSTLIGYDHAAASFFAQAGEAQRRGSAGTATAKAHKAVTEKALKNARAALKDHVERSPDSSYDALIDVAVAGDISGVPRNVPRYWVRQVIREVRGRQRPGRPKKSKTDAR